MHRRPRVGYAVAAALLGGALLGGCGAGSAPRAVDPTAAGELAAHDGRVCPERLPQASADSHGFGTSERAESAPDLAEPDSAWVCQYATVDAGPQTDGEGAVFAWERQGDVRPVPESRLPALAEDLDELVPAEERRVCPQDLGPRWMLVTVHDGDLTGVVVDDYGCQAVRLTDEPFETVPGEATEGGTVPGVLVAPEGFLDALREIWRG